MIATLMLAVLLSLSFSGCDSPTVRVESTLNINENFRGSRTVTVVYPLSADIDSIKDEILDEDPTADVVGASFSYDGVAEDGYYFVLELDFSNKSEYEDQVSAIIGRSANTLLSRKDTVMTRGTRMTEDFDTAELISWMSRVTSASSTTKDLSFDYSYNTVNIGSQSFSTGSAIDIDDCEGITINSISVKTYNKKDGLYDRTFIFSIPNQTFIAAEEQIKSYFEANTDTDQTDWSVEGTNVLYTVMYKDLSISELEGCTALILDTDNVEVFYGDKDNSSTPLSEGLTFEESLDTLSFIGADNGAPALEYSYSLPTNTIHGDGTVFKNGRWVSDGKWEEGAYKVETSSGFTRLRIPDGIQYTINGINFYLESLGNEQFRRTTSFLYSKTDGYDGMNYATDFFTSKGAQVLTDEDDDNLICSVICEGTTAEITAMLVDLFGSGNFMAYQQNAGALSLSVKTVLTDYVNLGYMLNSSNANRPMYYYVTSNGGENIVSVSVDGTEIAYTSRGDVVLAINAGCGTVEYRGIIPIISHVIIYIIVGVALLLITVLIVLMLLRRQRRPRRSSAAQDIADEVLNAESEDDGEGASFAPMQTTTFSILELGALSRNKKYVEEINKDIEERLEADRLEERKKELKAKELEEMGKKVYGTPGEDEPIPQEESVPEPDPDNGEEESDV